MVVEPSDDELRYIGLSEAQIECLDGWPNETRLLVYEEQLKLLMERSSDYDNLLDDLNI